MVTMVWVAVELIGGSHLLLAVSVLLGHFRNDEYCSLFVADKLRKAGIPTYLKNHVEGCCILATAWIRVYLPKLH